MAKSLLETKQRDEDIYDVKIKLARELAHYDKVKDNEQIKALVDFLEYLFLIQDPELEKKYEDYRNEMGGALKMTVDEIRRLHYKAEGKVEGEAVGERKKAIEIAKNLLDVLDNETIAVKTGLPVEVIEKLR